MTSQTARQEELMGQLNDAREKERLKKVEPKLREAVKASEQIPLRTKTQFMLYPETRTLIILKAIAEADDVNIQDFIRNAVDAAIEKRLRPPKRRARKKVTSKKGA